MPLYDCMLLLKPHVRKEALMDLVARVGKHVYSRNGIVTDIKSFGTVQLGYGIKKLDGRHYQGQLMQMIMMATPNINKELHYLNKEDRLLRWLLVKHRDIKFGLENLRGESDDDEGFSFRDPCLLNDKEVVFNDDGEDSSSSEDDYNEQEYEEQDEKKE